MAEVSIERVANSAENPRLNVVFMHGLGSDAHGAWAYEEKEKTKRRSPLNLFRQTASSEDEPKRLFWPEWLGEDMPGAAVYLVDYPANKMGWNVGWPIEEASVAVLDRLMKNPALRKSDAPIVFICHSLGGVVTKQLILKANSGRDLNDQKDAFLDRVAGVVFLATPHDGSILATLASQFGWLVTDTMRDLVANTAKLGDLSDNYRDYIAANDGRIRHLIYYEKEGVGGVKVVLSGSANPGIAGAERIPIGRDHIRICKIAKRSDQVYEGVLAFLEEALKPKALTPLQTLWSVEADTAAIKSSVERLTAELFLSNAKKEELAAGLAKVQAEYGGTVELVSGFLETMVGRKIQPEQFATTLFKIAADWKTAGEKIGSLTFSSDLSPHISLLRDQAKTAHEVGRLNEAERLLAEIAREEIVSLEQLEAHEREVLGEIRLRKRSVAETKAAQAAVSRTRLDYRAAAALFGEAADLVRDFDAFLYDEWITAQTAEMFRQGDEFGDNAAILEAINRYRQHLERFPPDRSPLMWAEMQIKLGRALRTLGEREIGTARLEEAVMVFREAPKHTDREHRSWLWAITQSAFGDALTALGEREAGTTRLKDAIAAYRAALEELTRQRDPFTWADTQNSLGIALCTLGIREKKTELLKEAVAAYREALSERTRDRVPLLWATTKNNLGNALSALGGQANFEEAVEAYRAALEEWSPDRVPLLWATAQYNLGNTLQALGEGESGTARLEEAITAFKASLTARSQDSVSPQWADTQFNLGNALAALGERDEGTAHLREAISAYRAALQESTQECDPMKWAAVQTNLGIALSTLGEREINAEYLEQAVGAFQMALQVRNKNTEPERHQELQLALKQLQQQLSQLRGEANIPRSVWIGP